MTQNPKPCPRCDGEGGWAPNPGRRTRSRYDWERGEEYRENWQDCPECHGEGTIETEDEDHE